MSFMAKIAAGAATLALAGSGLGMVGTQSASAKTPSCGGCTNWYTQKFGPAFVLDDLYGQVSAGNAVILFQASNSDPAEDFVTGYLGPVDSFYDHHHHHNHNYLISPGFEQAYGHDEAIEIRYEPLGADSDLCVGTWPGEVAQAGFKIRLEACGQASTLFAIDEADASGDYTPLITGTDTNYSSPLVLNYPAGHPTDLPRPWLTVEPLSTVSNMVSNSQLWKASMTPVP